MQRLPRHDVAPTIEEHLGEPVGEQGWALVDVVTGEPMVPVDDGYGSPTVAGGLFGPVADLLARAPELEAQVGLLEQALLSDSPALREQVRRNLAAGASSRSPDPSNTRTTARRFPPRDAVLRSAARGGRPRLWGRMRTGDGTWLGLATLWKSTFFHSAELGWHPASDLRTLD